MSSNQKTALVTGANRGIGFETATQLARRGLRVVLTARDEKKGLAAAREVTEKTGAEVEFRQLDISNQSNIADFARKIIGSGLQIDLLVNNAAITIDGFNENVARRTIDTNFYGPMRLTDALLAAIPNGGTVVMVSSSAGELSILSRELQKRFADPNLTREGLLALVENFVDSVRRGHHSEEGWPTSAYGVSKTALNALVRVTAPNLAARSIRINAVCPGWVRSDMGGSGAPRSLQQGAASVLWAAMLDTDQSGGFFRDGKPIRW
ncbi:MAG TPA: SDR family NAD(P)-dependent oxidoreductase [Spirochaetia bacterium]|nr:SDR family NAD(P)-dependent oxidoreductase [Spirochaetia bacterium]